VKINMIKIIKSSDGARQAVSASPIIQMSGSAGTPRRFRPPCRAPHPNRNAGHRCQRGRRTVAGRFRSQPSGGRAVTVGQPAAAECGSQPRQQDLQVLRGLIEAGKLTSVIDRTFSLSQVPQAIRYLVEGHGGGGKIVITV
jgi:NADPH:quinone reductase-like Zn-dependent oxidoreductase